MLDTLKELNQARDAAVAMRDNASELVEQIDRLLSETPTDLGGMLDSIKDRVLRELSGKEFSSEMVDEVATRKTTVDPVREDPKPDVTEIQHGEKACEFCPKGGFKNEMGYMIHLGRQHPREAAKIKKERKAAA